MTRADDTAVKFTMTLLAAAGIIGGLHFTQVDARAARLAGQVEQLQRQVEQLQCEDVHQNRAIYPELPRVELSPESRAAGARDVCEGLP